MANVKVKQPRVLNVLYYINCIMIIDFAQAQLKLQLQLQLELRLALISKSPTTNPIDKVGSDFI